VVGAEMKEELTTIAANRMDERNEDENIKRAAEIREGYKRPSQDALVPGQTGAPKREMFSDET